MQKTGSGFGTSRRLPEGALADLEPSPLAFIETPAARLSKLRLTASVTLEKRRGGGFAIVRSRPFRPRGKSAQAQSAAWKTRLRSILETYGKPAASLRLSRIHLRLALFNLFFSMRGAKAA